MQMRRFNLGPVGEADCPVFDGMFEFFRTYCGGSVGGAGLLNNGDAGVCLVGLRWGGSANLQRTRLGSSVAECGGGN